MLEMARAWPREAEMGAKAGLEPMVAGVVRGTGGGGCARRQRLELLRARAEEARLPADAHAVAATQAEGMSEEAAWAGRGSSTAGEEEAPREAAGARIARPPGGGSSPQRRAVEEQAYGRYLTNVRLLSDRYTGVYPTCIWLVYRQYLTNGLTIVLTCSS